MSGGVDCSFNVRCLRLNRCLEFGVHKAEIHLLLTMAAQSLRSTQPVVRARVDNPPLSLCTLSTEPEPKAAWEYLDESSLPTAKDISTAQ